MKPLKPQRERIKPADVRPVTSGAHPNDALTGTVEEWDEAVFKHAHHFSVCFMSGPQRDTRSVSDVDTFPEARWLASAQLGRTLVYAITAEGRSTCLVMSRWDRYQELWDAAHP